MHLLIFLLTLPLLSFGQASYSKDIAPIFREKCEICHRPNDIGPFSLNTYEQVSSYAAEIELAVSLNRMPPWKPAHGIQNYKGDFSLTPEERSTILNWITAGIPQGDPAELPPPISITDWPGGHPDLTLQMPLPYEAPTRGDQYRCFVLPMPQDGSKFFNQIQVKPGNRRVVHHVLLYSAPLAAAQAKDQSEDGQGYTCFGGPGLGSTSMIGAWVPGMRTQPLPSGVAVEIKPGEALIMQIHYHGASQAYVDQTQVGLNRSPESNPKLIHFVPLVNMRFSLPPEKVTAVNAEHPALISQFMAGKILFVAPHMHLLGTSAGINLKLPNGAIKPLIQIPSWDFNWQGAYQLATPIDYPKGSTLQLSCRFDNTSSNPNNPNNPLKTVTWGEGTNDEMCLGFVGIVPDQPPPAILRFFAGWLRQLAPKYLPHANANIAVLGLVTLSVGLKRAKTHWTQRRFL